jgi:hypothetical protein
MEDLKTLLREMYSSGIRLLKAIYWLMINLGYRVGIFSVKNIPIIINNYNRLTYPKRLIAFLEENGYRNIVVIDNNSTYPPLLKFYESFSYEVIYEKINYGHLALWKSGLYKKFWTNYFVYTDSDVVPIAECPADFLKTFKDKLDDHYNLDKIGFGIRIDDLPNSFSLKKNVVSYESRYWEKEVQPGLYDAPIDTTFALYKPFSGLKNNEVYTLKAYRMGSPYLVHHLPWYVDSNNLSKEEQYYRETANASSSISTGRVYE